ncbi:MAG: hypothetical protein ABEH88_11425 [Halobacteriales archaeon]
MFGDSTGSRIIAVAVGLLGVGALVVGAGGLYVTLTASDDPPERGAGVLGEYGCEPADRDVRSVPDSSNIERTVLKGDRIESVNTSDSAAGARLNLSMEGSLLNVSATRFSDGPEEQPNVTVDGDTILVTDPQRAPFRLWIDEVADGTVIRTELDVCPPARGD